MADAVGHNARERLRSFVLRLERLNEETTALSADKAEVFSELSGEGFCKKTVRRLLQRRKKDRADLQEEDAMLDLYEGAMRETRNDAADPLA